MLKLRTQYIVSCLMAANMTIMMAGAPAIGVAVKNGSFTVNGSRIDGNATLFDGNRVETGSAATRLQLNSGARWRLDASSAGTIYGDRLVLEKGVGELESTNAYNTDALSLRVTTSPGSSARIAVIGTRSLHVDALRGDLQVLNSKGVLIARLAGGKSIDLIPPPDGAAPPTKLTGVIEKKGDHYFIQDETSHVTVEIQGEEVSSQVGKRVELEGAVVDGASPAGGASQLIHVTKVVALGKIAGGAGAAGGSATIAGVGLHTAVIAGVGVAAAAAGAGVILSNNGSSPAASPSSR